MAIDLATQRQIEAADPVKSTWLSANAGSGKTRVLTDRVARLLLDGVPPQNILCLTYTKAAASEMQNRLFKRLGQWAMKDDADLQAELAVLGAPIPENNVDLSFARTIFASALEAPGGLRIQTIHSFCAALLRRFPLEAGVSPLFKEMDERTAKRIREQAIDEMIGDPTKNSFQAISRFLSTDDLSKLSAELIGKAASFSPAKTKHDIWNELGLPNEFTEQDLLAQVFLGGEADMIKSLVPIMAASDKETDRKNSNILRGLDFQDAGIADLAQLIPLFVFDEKAKKQPLVAKTSAFPTKKVRDENPVVIAELHQLMQRVEAAREPFFALMAAEKTCVLHRFANEFLPIYSALKNKRAWLDFDDLISLAGNLLSDSAVAQWVLFRLDGGIDHILIDEAQDTNPNQWKIVELLAQEFTAGKGTRPDTTRTIFVVGDQKQSIYSFQGADPDAFDKMRKHFGRKLEGVEQTLFQTSLEHSFRSSSAILEFVDSVFSTQDNLGLDGAPSHQVFHKSLPGRVDLWPLVPESDKTEERSWWDPQDKIYSRDHRNILATTIAQQIQEMESSGSVPDGKGTFRKIQFGDILVLVQSRSPLFHQIIRACKSLELPIAGADRLKVAAELAVKDLRSLLAFLAFPGDDLSLAEALRSPLFGITEDQLFGLAHHREDKSLWSALTKSQGEFSSTCDVLNYLLGQTDFLNPYELLERVLTRHHGRQLLIARLGLEAEVGIDAILSLALEYEQKQTPSLTGFISWMDADELEIKRQTDAVGGRIRVMTTHGAKGLESPIVILPDTGDRVGGIAPEIIKSNAGFPMWKVPKGSQPFVMTDALQMFSTRQSEERERLLYVALTRAETWLIICGSGKIRPDAKSWYLQAETGMNNLASAEFAAPTGNGQRFQKGAWAAAELSDDVSPDSAGNALPGWALTNAPTAAQTTTPFVPSASDGTPEIAEFPSKVERGQAILHGNRIHKLLEYLPELPQSSWSSAAAFHFAKEPDEVLDSAEQLAFETATRLLMDKNFSHIFEPNTFAEISISADLSAFGLGPMRGVIDRLVVDDEKVLIVDFKSNSGVPKDENQIPHGILRQLGAYLVGIEQIFVGRTIEIAVLWTTTGILMRVSHDIVMNALKSSQHLDDPGGGT